MEWINIKDRLPEKNGNYLVSVSNKTLIANYIAITEFIIFPNKHSSYMTETYKDHIDFNGKDYPDKPCFITYREGKGNIITHWKALPKTPKEVDASNAE